MTINYHKPSLTAWARLANPESPSRGFQARPGLNITNWSSLGMLVGLGWLQVRERFVRRLWIH
jgi:hypothetical protein